MVSELRTLHNTLNQAINIIEGEFSGMGLPELSTYAQEVHPLDDGQFLPSMKLFEARRLALACIGQLRVLLQVPYEKVVEQSCAVYDTACLDVFVKAGLVDELAKPIHRATGLHVMDLHAKLDLSPARIAAILRYLSAQGWLHERAENIFVLNRPALELLPGSNGRKWSLTPGKPKIAASLLDFVTHPEWKYSLSTAETAFQLAHNTHETLFEYLKHNPTELTQWASSVQSYGDACRTALLQDYPWETPISKLIVDCGGGQGCLVSALANTPSLANCNFVIQDLPEVVSSASANIAQMSPQAMLDGRITVEVHNFFEHQPHVADGTVFIFKHILHNWPDSDCVKILKNVAGAVSGSHFKILIIENIVVPSTVSFDGQSNGPFRRDRGPRISNAMTLPNYIPSNFGANSKMSLALGVHMMGVFNARERSLAEWEVLACQSGLRIAAVYPIRAYVSILECVFSG
ncbi:O-methyltransferase-domain-containing protein [Hygrophoropsis aurantiaca]|uniref:O-methyltransferase-domain-containing protein n=1 Tax=Hygrophoropsis aurantiaca TaxID=72124 RepID=A0ACB7ZZX6_9AGAM|nr:O-methyltransferase-domain-containing protein [Hygrophoropsis aurantiaca]